MIVCIDDTNIYRVHIFTTFWFSRLTSKPSPIEARKDPVKRRYDRVKRWTRKVNIFEKDFVVVPINENYHWYRKILFKMTSNIFCIHPGTFVSFATLVW